MIKRTLYFGNPAYLSMQNEQLIIKIPEIETNDSLPQAYKDAHIQSIPIEDIGVIVIDNQHITFTSALINKLLEQNCAVITCNNKRMPMGLFLPLSVNTLQNERFTIQMNATLPLKKQLWQQTVQAKILNQAKIIQQYREVPIDNMLKWAKEVKSGDSEYHESRAAVYYWKMLFPSIDNFVRDREGIPPNNLLNYGYAILRAVVARSLVGGGLLPTLGIHHHNRYNAYCLADDIMEPYRPYVDQLVVEMIDNEEDINIENKEVKAKFLSIPTIEVKINKRCTSLMNATTETTTSLFNCFKGISRKLSYPVIE
ncbi:MAG TPA: type II CRISPR-associated endonuclease Cas1 [Bacteroidales bacterium]|nr:type II CRISPR-associated endonuclease Cas1 [Bacteroidales bacterium]